LVQHFVVDPVQSLSTWQSISAVAAGAQTFWAPATSDRTTHAWPAAVLHEMSEVQKWGHAVALWQTLADP
jgi:hypothetical protein